MPQPPPFTPPVRVRHAEPSMLFSADDDSSQPNDRLFDLALRAIQVARGADLAPISERMKTPPFYPDIWPGEHYKLLAGIVSVLQPRTIIEVGTSTGLSALTMKHYLPPGGRVITFDILPWTSFSETCLRQADFADGQLIQHIADLANPEMVKLFKNELQEAEFIFLDAAKDGVGEQLFIDNLRKLPFATPPIVLFDDIRLWNMLKIWREIQAPKLDVTSFGHWSGTGLVDWIWDEGKK